jgi:hypothetical protein
MEMLEGWRVNSSRQLLHYSCAKRIDLCYGCHQYYLLEDLNMQKISAKFVSRLLTDEQQENQQV